MVQWNQRSVMVFVSVPPVPIIALVLGAQFVKRSILAMLFCHVFVITAIFVTVPIVIIVMRLVVDSLVIFVVVMIIILMLLWGSRNANRSRCGKCSSQNERTDQIARTTLHRDILLARKSFNEFRPEMIMACLLTQKC